MKDLYIKTLNTMTETHKDWPELLRMALLTMEYLIGISEIAGKITFDEYLELQDMIEKLRDKYIGGTYGAEQNSRACNL